MDKWEELKGFFNKRLELCRQENEKDDYENREMTGAENILLVALVKMDTLEEREFERSDEHGS